MKRIISAMIATALVVLSLSSCNKASKAKALDVTGIWELTDVSPVTKAAVIGDQTVEVFIQFLSNGSFSIYQKIGAGAYKTFDGTWTLTGDVLDGVYSDTKAWGSTYTVAREGDTMTLTSSGEAYLYKKVDSLPSSRL